MESFTHRKRQNFTIIQNELIRDSNLSCKAFKLLCIGLSHDGKWKFVKNQIATCFKEGLHTVNGAMKELRDLGYLHLVVKMDDTGKLNGHKWFWFEEPITEEEFKKFHRKGDFQALGDQEPRESGSSETHSDIRREKEKNTKDKKRMNEGESFVRSFSLTDEEEELFIGIQISDSDRELFAKRYREDPGRMKDALVAYRQKGPADGAGAWLNKAWNEGWKPNKDSQVFRAENRAFALDKIVPWEGKEIRGYTIHVCNEYVEFAPVGNGEAKIFEYSNMAFVDLVTKMMKRLLE